MLKWLYRNLSVIQSEILFSIILIELLTILMSVLFPLAYVIAGKLNTHLLNWLVYKWI